MPSPAGDCVCCRSPCTERGATGGICSLPRQLSQDIRQQVVQLRKKVALEWGSEPTELGIRWNELLSGHLRAEGPTLPAPPSCRLENSGCIVIRPPWDSGLGLAFLNAQPRATKDVDFFRVAGEMLWLTIQISRWDFCPEIIIFFL